MNGSIDHAIAVIGMAGRFPGAKNLESFWTQILQGNECITSFSNDDLLKAGISKAEFDSSHYVKARGVLEDVELFDADFFVIPPLEAELIDPQHRLFLECAYEALENAGCRPDRYPGAIGVYGGTGRSTYFLHNLYSHRRLMETMGNYLIRIGTEPDFLTTRVAHKLNLKGPCLSIQTACSTSLVAICMACNQLLTYQCDVAIAGGTSIFLPQQSGYVHQEGMIFSPDGHCRPFDANAQGTVPSNGVGVVVLKRLEDALNDRDHIYAVVRGYGLNNDGGEKMSYSAPSVNGQAAAVDSAIVMAEVDPSTISYVETHGTATFLGDPIEIEALTKAYRQYTEKQGFCAIGSVKGNIGHTMEAAGVAGFIKAVLALHEKKLPPTIHCDSVNPHIQSNSPFYVNTTLREWPSGSTPRRAGVSSFGIGGTNAHLILEEAPERNSSELDLPHLLILSAKTPSALKKMARNLGQYLKDHPSLSLSDVAYTLQIGRMEFKHRKAILCRNRDEAIASLQNLTAPQPETAREKQLAEMGQAWESGAVIDWQTIWTDSKPSRVPLPTYPFEKKRYWVDPPSQSDKTPSISKKSSNLEAALLNIWKEFLGLEAIGLHDDFFILGGDSLLAIQVISQIEKELGVSIKLQTFYQSPTISQLAVAISQLSSQSSSLVPLKKAQNNNSPPFFLLPGIDGNVFSLQPLAKAMTFQGPIYGIQSQDTEPKKIEEIASFYLSEIAKVQPEGPYYLCGSSFGGIIAYEMARQLKEKGQSLGYVGMIDVINPAYESVPRHDEKEMMAFLIELLEGKETSALPRLAPEQLAEKLLTPMGLHILPANQKLEIFERIQRHLKALADYSPKPLYSDVEFFQANERFFRMKDISFAATWQPFIKGKIDIREIAGEHLSTLIGSNALLLASQLDASLKTSLKCE